MRENCHTTQHVEDQLVSSPALSLFQDDPRELAINTLHARTAIYTREETVEGLLSQLHWPAPGRVLADTSCGDGAFLRVALTRLLHSDPLIGDEAIASHIVGWEIHPIAAREAQANLAAILRQHGRADLSAQRTAKAIVRCGDFLTQSARAPQYDLIVGNPPYLRFVNVPELLREEYRSVVPDYACADVLHSFLDHCAASLTSTGVCALVCADRWLFNESAARLRQVIGERLGIASLHRLNASSCFYRPKLRKAGTPPRVHPVAVVLEPRNRARTALDASPVFPGAATPTPSTSQRTLAQIADVRLAPWLGTPGIFLVDAPTARSARLPASHLVPAVDTHDVRGGCLQPPSRFAILTRPDVRPAPEVVAHLERTMPTMCRRGRRSEGTWLPPEPFYAFDFTRPSLMVARIARRLRPIRVPAGTLPVNHNLSIVQAGSASLEELEALLMSAAANEWVQQRAPRLENEYYSLTTRLLRKLPVV